MAQNISFNSNGSSKCPFCNTVTANGDPKSIRIIRLSKPSDQKTFHIFCSISGGLRITAEQKKKFDQISSGKLEPLYLNDRSFNRLNGYIKSLQEVGSHENAKRQSRSTKIINEIIRLDKYRLSEDEINQILQVQTREYSEQGGGNIPMAAAVA